MFCLSLLSVGLNQVLNSVRSWKKSDYNAVKLSYELNFRHSRFISYLFTIHSQGLLHFTPHGIHVNHDSRNTFFLIKSRFTDRKKPDHGFTKIPFPPSPPPFGSLSVGSQLNRPVLHAKTILFHPWLLCISNHIYFSICAFF